MLIMTKWTRSSRPSTYMYSGGVLQYWRGPQTNGAPVARPLMYEQLVPLADIQSYGSCIHSIFPSDICGLGDHRSLFQKMFGEIDVIDTSNQKLVNDVAILVCFRDYLPFPRINAWHQRHRERYH